jgi:hypothetical protein
VKTAQVRLGHSDPRLTIAIYAQATNEGDRNAAAKLGARFFPQFPETPGSCSSSRLTEGGTRRGSRDEGVGGDRSESDVGVGATRT